jgi:hypothetical protein
VITSAGQLGRRAKRQPGNGGRAKRAKRQPGDPAARRNGSRAKRVKRGAGRPAKPGENAGLVMIATVRPRLARTNGRDHGDAGSRPLAADSRQPVYAGALRSTAPTRWRASPTAASRAALASSAVSVRSGARNLSV